MPVELHYWNLRALGEPVRLMLEYLEVDYVNKHPEDWRGVKYNLGLKYPNLPYLVDGNVKLTESLAIMKYLSRKHKALGASTEAERQAVDTAEGFMSDFRMGFIRLWFHPDYENEKKNYFKELPNKLRSLEEVLGTQKWAAGKLTYVDFGLFECLDHHEMCQPGCLACSPNVQKYYEAFAALPKIAAYRNSGRFQKWPVSGGNARWGLSAL